VNLLRLQEGPASNQVLLRVRFAEVSRSALTDLGASFFTGPNGYKNVIGRSTTQQYAAPVFDNSNPQEEKLVFSDFLNLFLFDTKHQLGTVIKALQTKGLFQSLAEPNLVARAGKKRASWRAANFRCRSPRDPATASRSPFSTRNSASDSTSRRP
jgi:Flp pilus assembly secretin CpaC